MTRRAQQVVYQLFHFVVVEGGIKTTNDAENENLAFFKLGLQLNLRIR